MNCIIYTKLGTYNELKILEITNNHLDPEIEKQ